MQSVEESSSDSHDFIHMAAEKMVEMENSEALYDSLGMKWTPKGMLK